MDYNVGDRITYRPFMGGEATGTVTVKESDIKNGRPGFELVTAEKHELWGYDSQILRVARRSS